MKLIRIIIASILFVALFTVDKIIDLNTVIDIDFPILSFCLYLAVYLFISYDILFEAFKRIIRIQLLDENFLMSVASIGAFALFDFPEAIAVMLFYQIGEYFQNYAVNKSRKSIASLMDIRPDYANIIKDGNIVTGDPEDVNIGDVIIIKPGEKIPLDGIIIEGNTTLDTSKLTGESLPKEVTINDDVISGAINITSTITVKVTKEYSESTVSKILDLVENATSNKAKSENFITKFAKYYTPIVCVSALLLFLIPGIITSEYTKWLYRALNFLVVSCPCALVISIPLSFFSGIGAASKYGILIKGSNYLEDFNNTEVFAFDKTGTLTKGNFKVVEVFPNEKKDEILHLACIAEYLSNHPIARPIIDAYDKDFDKDYTLTNVSGYGIIAKKIDTIFVGNKKFMEMQNIDYIEKNAIGTVIYVAKNNEFVGSIVIADEIKENAKNVIETLNKKSSTVMLTGDNYSIAENVSKTLNLSDFKASLLPQDKVSYIQELKDKKVSFIGDGINDAPVLVSANIGIAMGALGSDAAIEAADIVLMNDELNDLLILNKIANKTMRIVKENIIFALSIKLAVLILSAFGITNMWIAVFADVGVAILAILNAMRINTKYKL